MANSSQNFSDQSKLKELLFAEDKINVTPKLKFVLGRLEKIVGKEEYAGCQDFLLFPQCFQKLFYQHCKTSGLFDKSVLTLSQVIIFRRFQTEGVSRRQFRT